MSSEKPAKIALDVMRPSLYSAVVADALDAFGRRRQSPRASLRPMTSPGVLIGRCRTTLWADMAHQDPHPYAKELEAVDGCRPDDVLIAAAGGSMRSGIWGELLSTAARHRGCAGAVVDGAVRDVAKMTAMGFPVFARGTSPCDSKDRQRVIDIDVPVDIDGVTFRTGDLVIADADGVVVVPQEIEVEVVRYALDKVRGENVVRQAILEGMPAAEAYRRYGVL